MRTVVILKLGWDTEAIACYLEAIHTLPEWVLVTEGDSRELHRRVVCDIHIHSFWIRVVVH